MSNYDHNLVEKKWQSYWEKNKTFEVKERPLDKLGAGKFYGLVEFPYASGDGLHTGHLRSYTAMDIICRQKRMQGKNVLYPMGFDNFGLPTENYAIKKGVNPKIIDKKNTQRFRLQLKEAGFSFDWSRSFSTTDEDYYKWTQWIFVQLFKKGLAYKSKEIINWCTACKIGLANEEVVGGVCERCGSEVVKKDKEQWVLKITEYAERLINDLEKVDYLERIKTQQINWIGRSEGAEVDFRIKNTDEVMRVFTTRPDTLFGATFMVVAPEHPLIKNLESRIKNLEEVQKYIKEAKKKSDIERGDMEKEKTGVELVGLIAINPINNEEIPIWVADYVMLGYGTGAIMAVPAHDQRDWDFAKKYDLDIVQVIEGGDIEKEAFIDIHSGKMVNSGNFNGMTPEKCIKKITDWLERNNLGKATVNTKLHDWIFSRQRYWGEPIPMVYCEKCGWVPVDEKDLPVTLPDVEDFMPTDEGNSPLAKVKDWIKVKCPKCGGEARRETDVMPNWAGSNWYFIRYVDPKNAKKMVDVDKAQYWLPVDWYNGGMEHTTLHLLYSRFIWKFLYDIGAVPKSLGPEPYKKRTAQGMVLGEGGIKMSKSKGNVINPDEYVKKYGADTVRVYEMFMGPFDSAIAWDDRSVIGIYRFLSRIWELQSKVVVNDEEIRNSKLEIRDLDKITHQTIKKVTKDIENMRFNTAISQMMILVNAMEKQDQISAISYSVLILLLSPFAPHMAEEIWEKLGHKDSIVFEKWPEYDEELAKEEKIELVVQVNGKVRDKIQVAADIAEDEAKKLALESEKVQKWLAGKEAKKLIFVSGKLVSVVV